jgi:hypothetical protein
MTTSLADIRRAICCPAGTCISPRDCYAEDRSRSQLVDIHHAARAVQALLLAAWRDYPRNDGPMVRSRTYGEEG